MAQFGAIYLTFDEGSIEIVNTISETLKQKGYLFTVRYQQGKAWIQLYVEEPDNTPYYTQEISKIFPKKRVIGFASYTVSDSVIFCEFQNGLIIRWLQSGFQQERMWDKIEGKPQTWEAEILVDNTLEVGSPGMMSFDIQRIGQWFDMPGFGAPKPGETWTKEIFN